MGFQLQDDRIHHQICPFLLLNSGEKSCGSKLSSMFRISEHDPSFVANTVPLSTQLEFEGFGAYPGNRNGGALQCFKAYFSCGGIMVVFREIGQGPQWELCDTGGCCFSRGDVACLWLTVFRSRLKTTCVQSQGSMMLLQAQRW